MRYVKERPTPVRQQACHERMGKEDVHIGRIILVKVLEGPETKPSLEEVQVKDDKRLCVICSHRFASKKDPASSSSVGVEVCWQQPQRAAACHEYSKTYKL